MEQRRSLTRIGEMDTTTKTPKVTKTSIESIQARLRRREKKRNITVNLTDAEITILDDLARAFGVLRSDILHMAVDYVIYNEEFRSVLAEASRNFGGK